MSPDRAHLPDGRLGAGLDALSAEVARIDALFAEAGAEAVEPAALQPADLMLALYGEDVRARAFVVHEPVEGEMMLRPDFTVPVLRLHAERGAAPARYRYAGPVWRRQEPGSTRPTEYLQAGYESLGEPDDVAADAETFARIKAALGGFPVETRTGDLAVAFAAVAGLSAPERWKAALRRHLWRPAAFRALLHRLGPGRPEPSESRAALIAAAEAGDAALRAFVMERGPLPGLRPLSDVMDRARELAADARLALSAEEIARLEATLAVSGPADAALARLRGLDPALAPALDRLERRLEALAARGEDPSALPFDASFGRALEYYDGFVFEFAAPGRPDLPPLAGGGRYDALTARLSGAALPAVGGILRPEALLSARGAA